jgi:hypothetical protein
MGLTVDSLLDDFESDGVAVRPPTDSGALQRVVPLEGFSSGVRSKAMKALPAYLAFFCLENAVRELVAERLAENYGPDWWDNCASSTMKTRVDSRRKKEGRNRWHSRRGEREIYYTDFGDLRALIINHWTDFEDLFPDQNWVTSRLDELENSRNVIAHNNILDQRELDRIRLYLDDWLRQVG